MKNLLPTSIEKRALDLIATGTDIIEAIKQALIEEQNMIGSLLDGSSNLTSRGEIARDEMFERYMEALPLS